MIVEHKLRLIMKPTSLNTISNTSDNESFEFHSSLKSRDNIWTQFKSFSLLFFTLLLFVNCNSDEATPLKPVQILPKTMAIVQADNQFGLKIFDELYAELNADENILISPLSMANALAMALNGAQGETYTEMLETLNLQGFSLQEVNETYKALMADLVSMDNEVVLSIANSIWYADFMNVKPDFIDNNVNYYQSSVTPLNFDDPASVDIINQWVSDNTKEKIESIIENLSPLDRMLLINAVYFKGNWKYQFEEADTYDADFYLEDGGSAVVPFMSMNANVERFSNELVDGLKLPYGKEAYSMYFFLPQANRTINEVIEQLNTDSWSEWRENFYMVEDVQIRIPRFSFEFESGLEKALEALGMQQAFSESLANFSGISEPEQLYISGIKHKTFIEVNEKGTEAAAVTSITFNVTSVNPITQFIANRAFLFAIVEESTGAIIFLGKLGNPLN